MKKLLFIASIFLMLALSLSQRYNAHVEYVYDGDTITADIYLGFGVMLDDQKIRLYGIDAPELRGEERPEGLISRDALRELIDGKDITMIDHGKGKYGRTIGELFIDTTNVSDWLVRNGYAEYRNY